LLHREIRSSDPVVGFENDGWSRFLTIAGERSFFIGGNCETCSFLFERKKSNLMSPTVISGRLSRGSNLLDGDLLEAAGSLLPDGDYAVLVARASRTS
jgi:hypothetical protein